MNLVKTSLLTFVATAIKIIAGLVINKAVSIFIGPSGIALIGQFQNFSQLAMTASQGGVNAGVTKYTAEYGADSEKLPRLWSTASIITLCCSVIVAFILIFLSKDISELSLKTDEYSYVFIVFGCTILFSSLNQLLLSILNGLKEIKTFIFINITQSLYGLIFTTLLVIFFGLDGALTAMVTNQSVVFVCVLWKLRNHRLMLLSNYKQKFDSIESRKLLSYSLMALTSACTVPISFIFIRNFLGENLSWEFAGYWQSIWYISSMYLMVVTTALSTYFLPRLSEITSKVGLRNELKKGYFVIIPLVVVLSFFIYLLRDLIVLLLFTSEFQPMLELFKWQLVGDVIKIIAWLLSYLMIAKALTKAYILTEVIFALSFVLLSVFFVDGYGLVGMTYAYAFNYFCYFICMLLVTRKIIF